MGFWNLGQYKDGADVLAKIIGSIGLVAVGAYLTFSRDEYEKAKFCYSSKVTLIADAGIKYEQAGVDARITLMEKLCPNDMEAFTQLLKLATQTDRAKAPDSDGTSGKGASGAPTTSSKPEAPSSASISGVAPLDGWVAVQFVAPKSYAETNFDLASKSQPGEGTPLTGSLAAGAILKARWQVNVRRGAADWRDPIGILDIGQCARVKSVTTLPAGQRQQIWADVAKIDCQAALAKP